MSWLIFIIGAILAGYLGDESSVAIFLLIYAVFLNIAYGDVQGELNSKRIDYDKLHSQLLDAQSTIRRLNDGEISSQKELEQEKRALLSKEVKIAKKANLLVREKEDFEAVKTLVNLKINEVPLLSKICADIQAEKDEAQAAILETKQRPAIRAAEQVREIKNEKRLLKEKLKSTEYKCLLYESIFPGIQDYIDDNEDTIYDTFAPNQIVNADNIDPVRIWLPKEDYNKLSPTEKNQRALENWFHRKKSKKMIGNDYENYIGYLYKKNGFSVSYFGIEQGKLDLGRDLICQKGNSTHIVQCKCWSKRKQIHEKHINQLFGTSVEYYLTQNKRLTLAGLTKAIKSGELRIVFVTSTSLSDTAKNFAQKLNIEVRENIPLGLYPLIKCNINRTTGEKIYHLPFDQQYKSTVISENHGEMYALTTAEAENAGFRRAKRYYVNSK